MLEKIQQYNGTVEGVIVGCFDDTGVDAARVISDAPVIGICQAACQYATILASSFTIVTTLERSVAALHKKVLDYGYSRHCNNIRASDIPVLALEACDDEAMAQLHREFEQAIDFLQRAYSKAPEVEVAAHLGEVLWERGEQERARQIWSEAFTVDDKNPLLNKTLERYGINLE